MAAPRSYHTFITAASAAIGAELGICIAGEYMVPQVDTALRTLDPPFVWLWVAAVLVHVCSALAAGWVGVRAGQLIGGRVGKPASCTRALATTASAPTGVSAAA